MSQLQRSNRSLNSHWSKREMTRNKTWLSVSNLRSFDQTPFLIEICTSYAIEQIQMYVHPSTARKNYYKYIRDFFGSLSRSNPIMMNSLHNFTRTKFDHAIEKKNLCKGRYISLSLSLVIIPWSVYWRTMPCRDSLSIYSTFTQHFDKTIKEKLKTKTNSISEWSRGLNTQTYHWRDRDIYLSFFSFSTSTKHHQYACQKKGTNEWT